MTCVPFRTANWNPVTGFNVDQVGKFKKKSSLLKKFLWLFCKQALQDIIHQTSMMMDMERKTVVRFENNAL